MQAILAMPSATLMLLSCIETSHIHQLLNSLIPRYTFANETVHLDYETLLGSNNIHIALYLSFLLREENCVNCTFCSVSCLLLERLPLRSTLYLEMMKKLIGR